MKRTKILWVSDNPFLCTGFARVTRELVGRFSKVPELEIACCGWGYDGWPRPVEEFPVRVYPSAADSFGQDSFTRILDEFKPDVVITLGEIWMIQWIASHEKRSSFKWIAYIPLDGGPFYPPWGPALANVDAIVAMSHFGKKILEHGLPHRTVRMIYHGVDTKVFRPLRPKVRSRNARFEDKIMVGCIARNQPRKNIPALIKAFRLALEAVPSLHLYLHMDPCDVGFDIVTLLHRYKLHGSADVATPDLGLANGLNDEELNLIYNLCVMTVLPTKAEGFGLPIAESLSAGTPVIATDYSACQELVRDRGELVKVITTETVGTNVLEHAVVDVEHMADSIVKLAKHPDLCDRYSVEGRRFAESLDWDVLFPQWLKVIGETVGTTHVQPPGAGVEFTAINEGLI